MNVSKALNTLSRNFLLSVMLLVPLSVGAADVVVVGLFKNAAVVKIDGERKLLREGQSTDSGVTLIKSERKGAHLSVNGIERFYPLGRDIQQYTAPNKSQVVIKKGSSGRYYSTGSINGRTVEFVIDTGATSIAINENQARRLGIDFRLVGKETVSSTASGLAKSFVVDFASVKLGEIELKNIRGVVIVGDFPTTALLGMSFLGQVKMEDNGSVLILEKTY